MKIAKATIIASYAESGPLLRRISIEGRA